MTNTQSYAVRFLVGWMFHLSSKDLLIVAEDLISKCSHLLESDQENDCYSLPKQDDVFQSLTLDTVNVFYQTIQDIALSTVESVTGRRIASTIEMLEGQTEEKIEEIGKERDIPHPAPDLIRVIKIFQFIGNSIISVSNSIFRHTYKFRMVYLRQCCSLLSFLLVKLELCVEYYTHPSVSRLLASKYSDSLSGPTFEVDSNQRKSFGRSVLNDICLASISFIAVIRRLCDILKKMKSKRVVCPSFFLSFFLHLSISRFRLKSHQKQAQG